MHGGRLQIACNEQKALLEELENLEYINEISIILDSDISVKKLLSSCKLQSCIRKLHLQCCSKMISLELSPSCVQAMVHLKTLQISSCDDLNSCLVVDNACGGFVAVDEFTEMKKEVKWARLLIKLFGKARPSASNILEGPRSYELQIWWEILPWVTGVYPVSSRLVRKNPKEEDEEGVRAAERVGRSRQSCNDAGQKVQGCGTKKKEGSGLLGSGVVNLVSGALMRSRGCGTYVAGLGEGKYRQVGLSAGANFVANGPSPDRSKSPADQRNGVHKTAGGADRLGGFFWPVSTGRRGGAYVEGLGDGKYKQAGLSAGENFKVIGPSPDRNSSPVE